MQADKRNTSEAIPQDIDRYLNEIQRQALNQVARFGVELAFIRRPLFQDPTAVLKNAEGDIVGVLNKSGEIESDLMIEIRH